MLSSFISSIHSYPAMLLAEQLVHQRYVHPGPLVLRTAPLKFPTPATDRDRTVSRRSEPSSRAAFYLTQRDWSQAGRVAGRGRGRSRLPTEQGAPCGTRSQNPGIMTCIGLWTYWGVFLRFSQSAPPSSHAHYLSFSQINKS